MLKVHPVTNPQAQSFSREPLMYLCADRLGPRDVHETVAIDILNPIGVRGEHVAQILAQEERLVVPSALRHPGVKRGATSSLRRQVEAWLSTIVRPTEVLATWFPNAGAASLRFRQPEFLGEWVRPINAGFGLTATIPIVVAGLVAGGRGLLIVENPEAHLHPKGQSGIAGFLARVAGAGTQVIIETHSDHVLNGVRRAVAVDRVLQASDVSMHFLDTDSQPAGELPRMTTIRMEDNGEVAPWPESFFDQMEKDLGALALVRRRRT
jgi:predicted ATPase